MSNINLSLHPKQSEVFLSEANEILYGGSAGAGKALSITEKIPTPSGWKTMGELCIGDQVFDENGIPCNVIATTEVMYNRPCYKVIFSDGTEVVCDEQHQWVTMDDKERGAWLRHTPEWREARKAKRPSRSKGTGSPKQVEALIKRNKTQPYDHKEQSRGTSKTTLEILNSLRIRENRVNHSVDCCKPVQYVKQELPIPPWLLGQWLGDGSSDCGRITSADEHNVQKMSAYSYDVRKDEKRDYMYVLYGLQKQLRLLGVLKNKHIPEQYLRASVEDRIELLQGLMDSDGYASKDGRCVFYNTNKRLIDGFMELAKSLGVNATLSEDRATLYGKDCGASYNVFLNAVFPIFTLPRRAERQNLAKEQYRRRYITDIVPVESVPVKCIQVDSPRNMFLCSESFIPTHNSHLMRVLAIAYAMEIPGLQVYLFRRTYPDLISNHMEGTGAFPDMLASLIESKHVKINWTKNYIEFWNGSLINLCSCQYDKDVLNFQGAQIGLLLVDELTHFSDYQYRFLRGRVRLGGTVVPEAYKGKVPKVVSGSNPGGVGHNWVKKTFIDFAAPNTINKAPVEEGGMLRQFIPAKLNDNPSLLENDPNYADRLKGLGDEKLVKAMLDGSWDIAEGGLFDDVWNRQIHVLKSFPIPSSWKIDRSFDWGSSKPYSVGFWAESDGTEATLIDGTKKSWPRGTLFRISELYGWTGEADVGVRATAKEIAEKIIEFQAGKEWGKLVKPGPADSAIYTKENGNCIADDMKAAPFYVKWVPADKRPGSRVTGWQNIRKRLKAAYKFPMEEPGLFIFEDCLQFIRTFPTLPRDKSNQDDCDSKSEDHASDESRYRCNHVKGTAATVSTIGL